MTKFRPTLFLAACATLGQPAVAAPAARQPIKPWNLDYGETACTASRAYGTAKSPLILAFRPSPNGHIVRVAVVRTGGAPPAHHFPVSVGTGTGQIKTTGLRFGSKDHKHDIVWINLERSALDALPGAGEIILRGEGEINERFALPQIAAVLKGLDDCNADLRRYWNMGDDEKKIAKGPQPTASPQSYVADEDYPSQALREDKGGKTAIVLLIDEAGNVKDCMVEETSGIATLDAMACITLVQRAHFHPALDAAGKPVRSSWSSRLNWVNP